VLVALVGAGPAWRAYFGEDGNRSSSADDIFGGDGHGGDRGD
jgi:hypothetical protein